MTRMSPKAIALVAIAGAQAEQLLAFRQIVPGVGSLHFALYLSISEPLNIYQGHILLSCFFPALVPAHPACNRDIHPFQAHFKHFRCQALIAQFFICSHRSAQSDVENKF